MKDIFIYPLKYSNEYKNVLQDIKDNKSPLLINGLVSSQKSHISYALFTSLKKQVMIICHSDLEAKKIYDDLSFYTSKDTIYLATEEIYFYALDAKDRKEETKRLNVLSKLAKDEDLILVTSIEACLKKYIPKSVLKSNIIKFDTSSIINIEELSKQLSYMGYERVITVEGLGQFSIRGGIIDIFPSGYEYPIRVELFDDEIDSIRLFDTISQKSIEKINSFEIIPSKEILYPKDMTNPIKRIKSDIKKDTNEDVFQNIEKIEEGIYFDGLENYIDYLYEEENKSIFSYLKKDALIVMNEPSRCIERAENYFDEFKENYITNLNRRSVLKTQGHLIYRFEELEDYMESRFLVLNSLLPKAIKSFNPKAIINFSSKEAPSFNGKVNFLIEEIKYFKSKKYKLLLALGSDEKCNNIKEELLKNDIECFICEDRQNTIKASQVIICRSDISSGFEYSDIKFMVISDSEIFGAHKKSSSNKQKKIKSSQKIESFLELKLGDYVVHEGHGIGKYAGIEQLKVNNSRKDYIKIVYSGGDNLYVPTEQMDKVQKYIGREGNNLKLNKLGTAEWNKAKSKVRKSVENIAKDLIELYAKREKSKGFRFQKDTIWQREFEELFPYEETADQMKAIIETKGDMESDKTMDRLICGDVGYGKTEVAIRGVFKACMDSKQVAFLVPTTILAQQHYNTLKERFKNYPIRIEVLSRFKTPKQQKQIVEDVSKGLVDILIGTHRIISVDISFKNLGLVVIDEEQRFGVKDKEKLKKLKNNVDVLTLSATPIPRTLHMSLSGIRDMSIIEEPPLERHPVLTYVVEARESIMADAIERELSRGGQVFFVYNRVESIEKIATIINKLVPEAKIAVGHGKMSVRQLEKVMLGFLEKEYNVLVCTTIIETGMDIQNANTIIIYDADKMGLSQLYQLRGRVGRSNRQGYAYFMYEKEKVLSEVAEKRLKAIKEFTEFGAGFKIAMRDLEIRGAGNLIGSQQHGHLDVIGYDLYVKMLSDAVRKLKGEEVLDEIDTEIDLNVNAYIPDSYISDETLKIEIYKKIACIENKEDILELEEELIDRFSDIPTPLNVLIKVAYIKSLGKKLHIDSVKQIDNVIHLKPKHKFTTKEKNNYNLVTEIANVLEKML